MIVYDNMLMKYLHIKFGILNFICKIVVILGLDNTMKSYLFFLITILFSLHFYTFGQTPKRTCPVRMHEQHHVHDSKEFLDFKQARRSAFRGKYIIPVIVHVMHLGEEVGTGTNISTNQIKSQIDVLNEDFNRKNKDQINTLAEFTEIAGSINIQFVLVDLDTSGNILKEKGVDRIRVDKHSWSSTELTDSLMPATIWNPEKYYNIWTVGNIKGFLGYAQFPDSSGLAGMKNQNKTYASDGMVIDYDHFGSYAKFQASQLINSKPFHLGRTATHEMGHALGLIHTWGISTSCDDDDYCEDTPLISSSSSGCILKRQGCTRLAMVQNYMDYSDDGCMNLFSKDQIARMEWVLANSPRRRTLTASARKVVLSSQQSKKIVKIYPQPASKQIHIQAKNLQIHAVEMIDMVGKKILHQSFSNKNILLPPLPNGLYVIKLTTNQGIIHHKILVHQTLGG